LYSLSLLGNSIIIKKAIVKLKEIEIERDKKVFKGKPCNFRAREHESEGLRRPKVPIRPSNFVCAIFVPYLCHIEVENDGK